VYDARKDYMFALKFFERNFGEEKSSMIPEGDEGGGSGNVEGEKAKEEEEEENEGKQNWGEAELVGSDTGEVANPNAQSGSGNMSS
jgi:hypothetical protein